MCQKDSHNPPYRGQCMCAKVVIEVKAQKANLELYCHCVDCTTYHSSLIVPYIMFPFDKDVPDEYYVITQGKELLHKLNYTEGVNRFFCSECGTPVVNEVPGLQMFGTFPNVISSYPYEPNMHVHYKNKRLPFPIQDGLEKHNDLPSAFGGSGKFLDDDYTAPMVGVGWDAKDKRVVVAEAQSN